MTFDKGIATGGGRFFGYKRDLPRHRGMQTDVRAHLNLFGSTIVSDTFSLRTFAAPTFDQNGQGSCGGHGAAQGLSTAAMSLAHYSGAPLIIPFVPSPRSLYCITRRIELGDPTLPLTDSGIFPTDLMTTASYFGVLPMLTSTTPDGRFSDIWDANVNVDPNFAELMTAGMKRQIGEYRIDETQGDFEALVRQTIAVAKVPVGVGIFVDSQVMSFGPSSSPVGAPNTSDPNGGGHWITIDGYTRDPQDASNWIYEVHNSWGSAYGDNGGFRGNSAWLRSASDLIAYTIR
jgi:hypothetical protein